MSVCTLTKRIVATAQPKDRAYELRDTQVCGLLLRVQPSGHKAWVVTWEHGRRRTLGSAGHLTLDDARESARKIIAEYIQTGLPSIAKPAAPKIKFKSFLHDHYLPWARSELKGADKYVSRLERVFRAALDMPMSEIDSAWVERWWMERIQTKARPDSGGLISKATAWRDLASFRAVIAKAVKWGLLEQNPIQQLRMKAAKPRSVVRFLSPAEEQRLRATLTARDQDHAAARRSANEWRAARKRPLLPDYVNVPHFAGKFAVERMLEQMDFNATILRPAYFMDNDRTIKDVVLGHGVYPMPIGNQGLAMIDARDIGEIAAIALLYRDQAPDGTATSRINLVGPDTLSGADVAGIWSQVLGRTIAYGGDDTVGFERNLRQFMPAWMAYDMRQMAERFLSDGMLPEAGDVERLVHLLGRPLRAYRDFAAETAASA